MYIFATATARTHIFNAFWMTHQLFYVLYVLTLLHGAVRVVQDPYFPYYFVGPAILFTLDKLVSVSRKKRKLNIIRTELLPSGEAHYIIVICVFGCFWSLLLPVLSTRCRTSEPLSAKRNLHVGLRFLATVFRRHIKFLSVVSAKPQSTINDMKVSLSAYRI
jgi:hypothetical protein